MSRTRAVTAARHHLTKFHKAEILLVRITYALKYMVCFLISTP